MNPLIIQLIVVAVGACLGSFITAASWRLPREEDIVTKPSHCPKCLKRLSALDLIPVFSWLFSRGKCRNCKERISFRYPLTEIITAAIILGLFKKYGLTIDFVIISLLAVALLIMVVSDFETYIMPDSTTIMVGVLAALYHYLHHSDWLPFIGAGLACLVLALTLKYSFWWLLKKDALGWGDIKFLPMVGLWLGFSALPAFFILSGVFGIIIGISWRFLYKNAEYPFGPALAAALLILIMFPEINLLAMR